MTEPQRFRVDVDVGRRYLSPAGELDIASAPRLLESVGQLNTAEIITLDLSRVMFLDAEGLGAIVSIRSDLIDVGGTLVLAGVQPRHARIFLIVGLASLLPHQTDSD